MADGEVDNTGHLTVEQGVQALMAPVVEHEEEASAESVEEEAPALEGAEPEDESAEEESGEETESEEGEEEGERLPPPTSWAAEDHDAWNALTPAAQAVVAKREADRDRAVAIAAQKAAEVGKTVKGIADRYEAVAAQITDDVGRAKASWQAKWGNVDWVRAGRELDPQEFNAYRAQAEDEKEQILAYEAHQNRVVEDAKKASQLARTAFIEEEARKLHEKMPELVDPKEGPARRQKVASYLLESYTSFTPELLLDASADELIIAEKARRWDESQAVAKKQAALPRKATTPPKAIAPGGLQGISQTRRNEAALSARLTKSGSPEDAVALLLARSQKAAKR
jgi:hypothetical protein